MENDANLDDANLDDGNKNELRFAVSADKRRAVIAHFPPKGKEYQLHNEGPGNVDFLVVGENKGQVPANSSIVFVVTEDSYAIHLPEEDNNAPYAIGSFWEV